MTHESGAALELTSEEGGLRHYLCGKAVHAGDILEIWWGAGGGVGRPPSRPGWRLGRYEWTFKESDRPAFYFNDFEGIWIKQDDLLRWPKA